ncbi:SsgA family sporulation/cell division regulator [Kitasatospora aureofaciens]|uniref:SsgA family sporulation/cell division regulator n=1 Tax=Kitasatospora aureofaciens TaxID=1894 RepID=UPI000D13FA03
MHGPSRRRAPPEHPRQPPPWRGRRIRRPEAGVWQFSRDLLREGPQRPAGAGDVRIRPPRTCHVTAGPAPPPVKRPTTHGVPSGAGNSGTDGARLRQARADGKKLEWQGQAVRCPIVACAAGRPSSQSSRR